MKIKFILGSLLASVALFATSCDPNEAIKSQNAIKVESSYVTFPNDKEEIEVKFTASDSWTATIIEEKDKKGVIAPWFEISPASGNAGEATLTLKAVAAHSTTREILITSGSAQQIVQVNPEAAGITYSTVAEINAGTDGVAYGVKGVVVGPISLPYGNYNVKDATGSIYIYGTLDAAGNTKNFASLGIEEGDSVYVFGPKSTYKGDAQLVNVTVLKHIPSLLKLEKSAFEVEGVASEILVKVTQYKGSSVNVTSNSEWIVVKNFSASASTAEINLSIAANPELVKREGTVTVVSGKESKTVRITQSGRAPTENDIIFKQVKDVKAAEDNPAMFYRVSGKVAEIKDNTYGNISLAAGKDTIYVRGITATKQDKNDKSFASLGIKVNDFVTIVGYKTTYKGTIQISGAYYVSHLSAVPTTVADFLAKEDKIGIEAPYYELTGTVSNIVMDKKDPTKPNAYGNFDLTDANGSSVYVRGLVDNPDYYDKDGVLSFSNDKVFPSLGIENGSTITIRAKKTSYNGTPQGAEAYLISKQ